MSKKKFTRKSRNSIQNAHEFYEEWMESYTHGRVSNASIKKEVEKPRSKYKFHSDYLKNVSLKRL